MADPKEAAAPAMTDGGGGDKSQKIVMGLLGLNVVVMLVVVVVLFLGQKKQASVQSIDQIAAGAAAEHGGGHGAPAAGGEHGAPAKGGEHGGGGGEHGGKGGKGEAAEGGSDVRFFSVGDFTSNLSGPASTNYIKVSVNFELSKEVDEDEVKKRRPQFRDRIISLLNSKKPAELQSIEGRNFLKEEIKTVINGTLQSGKIEGVYFSSFIVN